jgi:lipoprotein-releasing system permease protein
VFTTLRVAQSLLDLPGSVTQLDLKVADLFGAEVTAQRIAATTGLKAESWMQTNGQLLAGLRNQTVTSRLIRIFVTIIVAVGIASVLVVSVVQKTRQIGILRAMGARRDQVRSIFLLQGGLVGLIGALAGAVLAVVLILVFSQIYRNADGSFLIEPRVEPLLLLSSMLVAFVTGLVSAWLPARRAALMDPVAAIRHD